MVNLIDRGTRSHIMSCIRFKDTKVEWMLRSALWKQGLRYRLHSRRLPGRPDIVFPSQQLAVFVDGDFWHGYDWRKLRLKLKNDFWIHKIKNNKRRDRKNTRKLEEMGWIVVRIWENELRKNPIACVKKIKRHIKN